MFLFLLFFFYAMYVRVEFCVHLGQIFREYEFALNAPSSYWVLAEIISAIF
ncbi:hypothetical protein OIU77_023655 [Salix suchowensis]|uniref:Uncharacterized protein n=1 Tax=Salix suchowensis TaxID=1278906 RepID=A0ABQ9C4N4_9ROSI|nr:hypothetical protein OIU77_023655 [Salix suchowensis]KAJ6394491.1 hypothetical protein OIU77_023655 [Salix suchowensis]